MKRLCQRGTRAGQRQALAKHDGGFADPVLAVHYCTGERQDSYDKGLSQSV